MPHYYDDDECDRCMDYVKVITDTDKWQCQVCNLVESTFVWTRYELSCQHQIHVRCFRTWCKKNGIGCIQCGPINENNYYCHNCKQFGHMDCRQ